MDDISVASNAASTGASDEFDFGPRKGSGFQDRDAQWESIQAVIASTPDEVHAQAELTMRAILQPENQKTLGLGDNGAVIVDNERVFDALKNIDPDKERSAAIEEATAKALEAVAGEAAKLAAGQQSFEQAGTAAGEQAGKDGAGKPLDLEQTLASIQMSAARDQRFVVSGDPKAQDAFFVELAARGKLRYQGGAPVIGVSRAKAEEIFREVCKREGFVVQQAVNLEFDRTGNGGISSLVAGVKNLVGRQNSVAVFVAGDQATVDKKLGEIGQLLTKMDSAKFISESDKKQLEGGQLKLEDGKPAHFKVTRSMQELVTMARGTVGDYQRDLDVKDAARSEFRNKEQDERMAKAAGKDGAGDAVAAASATPGAATKAGPPSEFIQKLQSNIHTAVNTIGALQEKDGKQLKAEMLLNTVRKLNDKDMPELAKLSTEQRQQMFTQLSAIIAKVDTGTFAKALTSEKVDKAYEADPGRDRAASPSIREKVSELIAAEKSRDPEFEGRALQILANMEKAGTMNREQVEKAAEAIAPGREIPPPSLDPVASAEAQEKRPAEASEAPAAEAAKQNTAELSKEQSKEASAEASADAAKSADAAAGNEAKASDAESTKAAPATTAETSTASSEGATLSSDVNAPGRGLGEAAADAIQAAPERTTPVELSSEGVAAKSAEAVPVTTVPAAADKQADKAPEQAAFQFNEQPAAAPSALQASAAPAAPAEVPPVSASDSVKASPSSAPTQAAEKDAVPAAAAPAQVAEKTTALVDKLDAVVKAGPEALTREDASALLATLDGRRTAKLASLDGRSGTAPTQTLIRVEGVLNEVAKGRLGDDLAAVAKDLGDALGKWKNQDLDRVAAAYGVTQPEVAAKAAEMRAANSVWHASAPAASAPAASAAVAPVAAPVAPPPAAAVQAPEVARATLAAAPERLPDAAAQVDARADARATINDADKIAAAERYTQTETAAGKLAGLMANPAGSFTNRDKTWNERNVDAAVVAVLRVDPQSTRDMSQSQRNQVAAYAVWLADNANSGQLPGFEGAAGKERANALTERATQLVGGVSGQLPPAVTAQLGKADRMVGAMGQRARGLSRSPAAQAGSAVRAPGAAAPGSSRTSAAAPVRTAAAGAVDATRVARDIGHAVFKSQELTEAYAKFLLKNSGTLTSDSMKTLNPQEKAEAAVGLAHLASEVRNGAMGDFKTLSPSLQKQVVQAQNTANQLHTELSSDPKVQTALAKAYMDLQPPAKETASGPVQKDVVPTSDKQTPSSAAERGLER